jgi:hypothetical protein
MQRGASVDRANALGVTPLMHAAFCQELVGLDQIF